MPNRRLRSCSKNYLGKEQYNLKVMALEHSRLQHLRSGMPCQTSLEIMHNYQYFLLRNNLKRTCLRKRFICNYDVF